MRVAKGGLAAFLVAVLGNGPVLCAPDVEPDGVTIVAAAYGQVPAAARFDLRIADDSALRYEIEQLVRASLQRLGYGLRHESPLVLTVSAEANDWGADTPWPLQLGASKGGLRMRLFLFGPNSSGLLQESRKPTAGEYRVSLSVHDRGTHGYLWRGVATVCRCGQGILASSRALVPALVAAIGRSVGPEAAVSTASK
jgi:hypothetical protein